LFDLIFMARKSLLGPPHTMHPDDYLDTFGKIRSCMQLSEASQE
jgi:hypothetical protein